MAGRLLAMLLNSGIFYGKFAMSWDNGTTPATRLKEWLDPTNIAGDTLNGFDPI